LSLDYTRDIIFIISGVDYICQGGKRAFCYVLAIIIQPNLTESAIYWQCVEIVCLPHRKHWQYGFVVVDAQILGGGDGVVELQYF